jgi:hypothetical protein
VRRSHEEMDPAEIRRHGDDAVSDCKHMNFKANVSVNRLEDTGRFMAEVKINCAECGLPFQFLGLPLGLNLNGASMSVDGQEARLGIAPVGRVLHPLAGVSGFSVRGNA